MVLVGLPGAGKTTVGRMLAERLGLPFLDFDEEIVRRTGRTIAETFAREGESHFRALEAEVTREMAAASPSVLAPGGGWMVQPGLVGLVRPPAVVVHLRVSPATAIDRISRTGVARPLLANGDPLAAAVTLWESRRRAYESADFAVDTEDVAVEEVVSRIVALIGRSA